MKRELSWEYIGYLERQISGATGKPCPECGDPMITLNTIEKGIRLCSCGYKESNKLKPGQKSLLVKGEVG